MTTVAALILTALESPHLPLILFALVILAALAVVAFALLMLRP
jgi:hypothetical protein